MGTWKCDEPGCLGLDGDGCVLDTVGDAVPRLCARSTARLASWVPYDAPEAEILDLEPCFNTACQKCAMNLEPAFACPFGARDGELREM